jgi:stage V sporulation protein AC
MKMKERDKAAYGEYVAHRASRSPVLRNCAAAFLVGGAISVLGQLLLVLYRALGAPLDIAATLVSVSLVFISVLLTALGVFDRIARFAGAGTLVPITGFANAVCSPAIDTKSEGMILGVGAKIFTVAGPVLLYGTLAGTLYGVCYYIVTLFV